MYIYCVHLADSVNNFPRPQQLGVTGFLPSSTLPPPRPQRIDHQPTELLDMRFSANTYSMEVTSDECLSEVRSLLSCSYEITHARSLRGNEAQMFIDFLDRVSELTILFPDNSSR